MVDNKIRCARFVVLGVLDFDPVEEPRRSAASVVVTNLEFLEASQLDGADRERVLLVAFELVDVAGVAQFAFAAVAELARHRHEHVGVGAGPQLVASKHPHRVVDLCNSSQRSIIIIIIIITDGDLQLWRRVIARNDRYTPWAGIPAVAKKNEIQTA